MKHETQPLINSQPISQKEQTKNAPVLDASFVNILRCQERIQAYQDHKLTKETTNRNTIRIIYQNVCKLCCLIQHFYELILLHIKFVSQLTDTGTHSILHTLVDDFHPVTQQEALTAVITTSRQAILVICITRNYDEGRVL